MPDVEGEEAPLGERPAADELALNVAQARIASKLFGSTGEVTVGRYKLLELVGRGGMGVVWGAWDPELERRIAIKLVDHLRPDARDRIVTEARALAKLSHPHVVPVHDVGVVDDRVYLVMEWVAGETLRAYKPRSERDIVDIYTQAARGLGAIHAAGFVHRDFKPDNAMIGGDHRVRVLDLGLARGDLDDNARREVAGTPRYMAPEQAAGATPTPAVDQFALCMSLREALEARGAVPRWLAAIIARGTAAKPEDRFASMDEVVRALGRDPARVWRRRIIVGVALAATATAFVVGRAAKDDPCSTTRANVLSPEVRARIASHLDGLGAFAQGERDALLALLDDRERGLQRMHRQACVAHDSGDLTTAFYERRLTCLARAESSLGAVAEILGGVTAARFPDARVAAGALVDPAHCTRVDQSLVPLPDVSALPAVRKAEAAVERARLLATAARPDAIDAATNARMAAEKIGYLPLVARAFLVEGRAELLAEKMVQASTTLETSMRSGFAAHDDAAAVEAFARMVFAASRGGKTVDGANVIDAVAARLGPDGTFARLLLLNNLAAARMSTSDDVAAAAPLLETAMRDWRPGESENDYELVSIPQNLALAISDPARSVELLASARSAAVSMLGERHPRVLEIDRMHALFVDLPAARTLYDRSCAQLAELFPELVARRAECEYQAGWLADEAGDRDAALAHFRAAPLDPKSRRAQIAAAMIALDRTNAKQIATELERDAETDAKAQFLFTRAVAADAYIAAARGWHEHGDRVAELRCWDGARRLLEAIKRPAFARRLARARAALEK